MVGPSRTKEMLYTPSTIDVSEAYRIGLVDRIHSPEVLERETYAFAENLSEGSQVSMDGIKRMVQTVLDGEIEEGDQLAELVLHLFDSVDHREGVQAFLEKRKPRFR